MFHKFAVICLVAFCYADEKRLIFFGSSAPSSDNFSFDVVYRVDPSSRTVQCGQISDFGVWYLLWSCHGNTDACDLLQSFYGRWNDCRTALACTEGGGAVSAVTVCMQNPSLILPSVLASITDAEALALNIDSTSHMRNDRVYIFNGKADIIVNPGIGRVDEGYCHHYVADPARQIKTVFNINAAHGQPTDNYGDPSDQQSTTDYINNCNYSAAYDLLNFIYGGHLKRPTPGAQQTGQLKKFDQTDFFYVSTPGMYSMDDEGYIYVPHACSSVTRKCKLHVALHGCETGQKYIGDHYVRHGGYNEVADLNNIIILYPQAIKSVVPLNPFGCWDWWGYTGTLFATNKEFQPVAIKRMIDKVTG